MTNEFSVIWSTSAKQRLDDILEFLIKSIPENISRNIIQSIIKESLTLSKAPFIGQKEQLLRFRSQEYRYLVISHFKILYYVDENQRQVKISDVFDTRQDPNKLKNLRF